METLSRDVIEKISLELSPKDFLNFCRANKKFCERDNLWFRRFQKDFKFEIPYLIGTQNWKETYMRVFYQKFNIFYEKYLESLHLGMTEYLDERAKTLFYIFYEIYLVQYLKLKMNRNFEIMLITYI